MEDGLPFFVVEYTSVLLEGSARAVSMAYYGIRRKSLSLMGLASKHHDPAILAIHTLQQQESQ